jgi:hypothetical protein
MELGAGALTGDHAVALTHLQFLGTAGDQIGLAGNRLAASVIRMILLEGSVDRRHPQRHVEAVHQAYIVEVEAHVAVKLDLRQRVRLRPALKKIAIRKKT